MADVLTNLLNEDKDYSESKFKSKVENEFVQIKLAMVTGKTEKIKHFVNDQTYEKIVNKVEEDTKNNRIQLYDELNVANIDIQNIEEYEDRFEIKVQVYSKAYEYFIDKETKKFISGNKNDRVEKYTNIVFAKVKNAKKLSTLRRCPTCGANVDVNANGRCNYCHTIFDLEKYDWIITSMEL